MLLLWGKYPAKVKEVRGDKARVTFHHPSETGPVSMWVPSQEAGIFPPKRVRSFELGSVESCFVPIGRTIRFTGGGVQGACHPCGNAFEECECA